MYNPELAEQKRKHRKRFPKLTPAVVASLPSETREDLNKILVYETPTVQRRQLVIDKYIKDYGSLILSNLLRLRQLCVLSLMNFIWNKVPSINF